MPTQIWGKGWGEGSSSTRYWWRSTSSFVPFQAWMEFSGKAQAFKDTSQMEVASQIRLWAIKQNIWFNRTLLSCVMGVQILFSSPDHPTCGSLEKCFWFHVSLLLFLNKIKLPLFIQNSFQINTVASTTWTQSSLKSNSINNCVVLLLSSSIIIFGKHIEQVSGEVGI